MHRTRLGLARSPQPSDFLASGGKGLCLAAWIVEGTWGLQRPSEVLARPNKILANPLRPGPGLWLPQPGWAMGLTAAKVPGAVCLPVVQSPAVGKQTVQGKSGGVGEWAACVGSGR